MGSAGGTAGLSALGIKFKSLHLTRRSVIPVGEPKARLDGGRKTLPGSYTDVPTLETASGTVGIRRACLTSDLICEYLAQWAIRAVGDGMGDR